MSRLAFFSWLPSTPDENFGDVLSSYTLSYNDTAGYKALMKAVFEDQNSTVTVNTTVKFEASLILSTMHAPTDTYVKCLSLAEAAPDRNAAGVNYASPAKLVLHIH